MCVGENKIVIVWIQITMRFDKGLLLASSNESVPCVSRLWFASFIIASLPSLLMVDLKSDKHAYMFRFIL